MSDAAMSVTIEWFGCATFRVRLGELTLFFDTYLDKAPGVPPAGLRAAEVDRADFLFISHAHWDHLYGADIIAKATGATVVGNYESVRLLRANGVPDAQILATAGGDTVDCGHGVTVRALPRRTPARHSLRWDYPTRRSTNRFTPTARNGPMTVTGRSDQNPPLPRPGLD